MPEKIKWKGGALLSPLPAVMVTCGTLEKPNIITIGWTGILCTNPPKTYISVRKKRPQKNGRPKKNAGPAKDTNPGKNPRPPKSKTK